MTYILSDYCQLFRNKNRLFIQSRNGYNILLGKIKRYS